MYAIVCTPCSFFIVHATCMHTRLQITFLSQLREKNKPAEGRELHINVCTVVQRRHNINTYMRACKHACKYGGGGAPLSPNIRPARVLHTF